MHQFQQIPFFALAIMLIHFILLLVPLVYGKIVTYDFNISYVQGNPDGTKDRRLIGINNQWPVPTIRVHKHDTVIINVLNQISTNTSLHFHGLFQKGSNAMDGPQMVTQCPIPSGSSFTYNFTVDQVGTYWYHSHTGNQYGDGLRGLFIIEDDQVPFEFDEEVTLTLSDWYHLESTQLIQKFMSRYNPTGAEPIPQNSLFNDTRNVTWNVMPDTTYMLRIVNMGLFTSQYLTLEDHLFTIVEIDGVYVEPVTTQALYIAVAQRVTVLVNTKSTASKNFRFVNIIDRDMLDIVPPDLQLISTNYMSYGASNNPKPYNGNDAKFYEEYVALLEVYDDFNLKPLNKTSILNDPDYQIVVDFKMDNLGDGVNYAFFNDISYTPPKVPTLYSVIHSGDLYDDILIYGSNTNSFILQKDEIIEIVLNNNDPGKHPFHLHGHIFQTIYRSPAGDDDDNPIIYNPSNPEHNKFPETPMLRDTIVVNPNGFIRLRFKADNPGVWLFHCHVDWHLEQGLAITLIEAPRDLQTQNVPTQHFDVCKAGNISSIGNAAGNYGSHQQWLDLTGELLQPPPLPSGFTTKGYVGLLLCTIVAIYGVLTIYQYGMEDVKSEDNVAMAQKLTKLLNDYGTMESEGISLQSDVVVD